MVSTLVWISFGSPWLGPAIKTNCMKLHTVDWEICTILIFSKMGPGLVSSPHFVHDFVKEYISCCVLLTEQTSLSDCLYILRYMAICVLQSFLFQLVMSYLKFTLSFLIKSFYYMTNSSEQIL